MKANVVHADLNPCGGAEQVALATIQALTEMDIDVELTTARIPDISRLRNVFGASRVEAIFNRLKRINLLDRLPIVNSSQDKTTEKADDHTITINTHGDMLSYYLPYFLSSNAITYCHYPLVPEFAREHDPAYLRYLTDLGLVKLDEYNSKTNFATRNDNSPFWYTLKESYLMMLQHSTILTNSSFSKDAILKILSKADGAKKMDVSTSDPIMHEPLVIPPPVNVEEFRNAALHSKEREDLMVVIARFNPSKKLENAIALAGVVA